MRFEWDPGKSENNQTKHGINFTRAQKLWHGPVLTLLSNQPGEARQLVIGQIEGKHWTLITTPRAAAVRIISARRSRENEKQIYEKFLARR